MRKGTLNLRSHVPSGVEVASALPLRTGKEDQASRTVDTEIML